MNFLIKIIANQWKARPNNAPTAIKCFLPIALIFMKLIAVVTSENAKNAKRWLTSKIRNSMTYFISYFRRNFTIRNSVLCVIRWLTPVYSPNTNKIVLTNQNSANIAKTAGCKNNLLGILSLVELVQNHA